MGKKMGINTKAEAAREAKAEKAQAKAAAKSHKQEEDYWDNVKNAESTKHGKKKEDNAANKAEKDARRAEARRIAKEEELAMLDYAKKGKAKSSTKKVTQSQLAARQAKKKQQEAEQAALLAQQKKNITTEDEYAAMVGQKIDNRSDEIQAQNIDEALAAAAEMSMSENAPVPDRHPEKRMKAAYKAYFEVQMPLMKEEYPGLKLSQYKDKIFTQWQKAPENPKNQQ